MGAGELGSTGVEERGSRGAREHGSDKLFFEGRFRGLVNKIGFRKPEPCRKGGARPPEAGVGAGGAVERGSPGGKPSKGEK
jgi:hypothetical protein